MVLIALLAFALFLSEGVAYDWSTVHLHDSLGADKSVAAWAFGAFSLTMTTVRLVADRLVARIGSAAYVQRAALVGAAGLSAAALAPAPGSAIAGWAVFGVGLAGCVPQFFSAAGRIDPDNAGLYMARVTSLGYLGLLAGPALIGILTRWVSLADHLPAADRRAACWPEPWLDEHWPPRDGPGLGRGPRAGPRSTRGDGRLPACRGRRRSRLPAGRR